MSESGDKDSGTTDVACQQYLTRWAGVHYELTISYKFLFIWDIHLNWEYCTERLKSLSLRCRDAHDQKRPSWPWPESEKGFTALYGVSLFIWLTPLQNLEYLCIQGSPVYLKYTHIQWELCFYMPPQMQRLTHLELAYVTPWPQLDFIYSDRGREVTEFANVTKLTLHHTQAGLHQLTHFALRLCLLKVTNLELTCDLEGPGQDDIFMEYGEQLAFLIQTKRVITTKVGVYNAGHRGPGFSIQLWGTIPAGTSPLHYTFFVRYSPPTSQETAAAIQSTCLAALRGLFSSIEPTEKVLQLEFSSIKCQPGGYWVTLLRQLPSLVGATRSLSLTGECACFLRPGQPFELSQLQLVDVDFNLKRTQSDSGEETWEHLQAFLSKQRPREVNLILRHCRNEPDFISQIADMEHIKVNYAEEHNPTQPDSA
ncbi:hypothetical protein CERSUDRAFT_72659 [Gelatoporia subvermispora B]|uniref:Uncharacterized protein n=1 Tax=Ceriporiopsis subvermispora (strain B) TaxID=914234 RepID=M2R0L4_CERS8|nr:hypothetical protein CERSUDRAFT_72659 [Gelatoporia subvermispora B]